MERKKRKRRWRREVSIPDPTIPSSPSPPSPVRWKRRPLPSPSQADSAPWKNRWRRTGDRPRTAQRERRRRTATPDEGGGRRRERRRRRRVRGGLRCRSLGGSGPALARTAHRSVPGSKHRGKSGCGTHVQRRKRREREMLTFSASKVETDLPLAAVAEEGHFAGPFPSCLFSALPLPVKLLSMAPTPPFFPSPFLAVVVVVGTRA